MPLPMFDGVTYSSWKSTGLQGQDISEPFLVWFLLQDAMQNIMCSIYVSWFQLPRKHQNHSKTHSTVTLHPY